MKKTILATVLLLGLTAGSQAQKSREIVHAVKKTTVGSFNKVQVDANIDVLLIEDNIPGQVFIEGDATLLDDINLTVVNNELRISARKNKSFKNKVSIGVTVKQLAGLEINADSHVSTLNPLHSDILEVRINHECRFTLRSTGKINFRSDNEIDLAYTTSRIKTAEPANL